MDERVGGRNSLGLAESHESDGTLGRIRCSRGGDAPSPPPELSVGGTKETRWTGEWDQKLAGPYGVSQGAQGIQAAFRRLRKGRSLTPPECSAGGVKETWWRREGIRRLAGLNRDSKESRRVWAAFVF